MKSLYLIRGVPGAGKSTLAKELAEPENVIFSADMYFEDISGQYNFDISKIKDAHAWCKEMVEGVMMKSIKNTKYNWNVNSYNKIFVANTFTQEWEMEDYFKLAEKYGYKVFTIIVENRHGSTNIHNVPDEIISKMKDRFEIVL